MKGIYCYVDNKTDDIVYVGKDSKIDKHNNRHYQHTRKCNYNHQVINKIIQNNPSRYTYEVLFKGKSKHIDDNLLNTLEMGYIETYKPKFNFTNGGDGRTGSIPWNKGKKFPKETHPLYGKHHSDETRLKISKNHHNVKGENNPRYREDIPQGKELYFENKSGLSYNELAEKYNCGWSTIQRRIKKYKEDIEWDY